MPILDLAEQAEQEALRQKYQSLLAHWIYNPVDYVCHVLGAQPDPWQCDVMDAVVAEESVGLRACHGVGKTALEAWIIEWFTTTRPFSKLPTTAPTFQKQVRDILWAEIHKWWRVAEQTMPWMTAEFKLTTTRLQHREEGDNWFAVGIASSQPLNIEGYHAEHLLAVFDEAKAIRKAIWDAVHGMRTTQEAKIFCASTPGGPQGEFYKVFTQYRTTWKSLFIIHPLALKAELKRKEAQPYSRGGTYYSSRVRAEWCHERAEEWGKDNPVYIARVVGDFPQVEGDVLIPYGWLVEAEERDEGIEGVPVVSCDVARYGRDRTVILAGAGGKLVHGESIARNPEESVGPDHTPPGDDSDPKAPRRRAIDATADNCQRVRRQLHADAYIVIDDTGLGGGVSDILRRRGEKVIAVNFGAAPTDKPRTPEQRESRRRRHLLESQFANLKAQMGFRLKAGFESESISIADLPKPIREAFIAQASMVTTELTQSGQLRIVDPDEQDEYALAAGTLEGKKSPDHFHSMLLYWWVASGAAMELTPKAFAKIPSGIHRFGQRDAARKEAALRPMAGSVGGQAAYVRSMHTTRR